MAFINEYISPEDKRKHDLTPGKDFYLTATESWTVDKERNIFLLPRTGGGPESEPGVRYWAFNWQGHLLDICMELLENGCDSTELHGWERRKIRSINRMPQELQSQRIQIIEDLKEALTAHKGLGIYSGYQTYQVTLETE